MYKSFVKKIALNVLYIAIVIVIVFGAWAIGAEVADSELILPSIGDTFKEFGDVFALDAFRSGLCGTMLRSLICYAISIAIAFLLFFAGSISYAASRIIGPIVSALRTLPTMAVSLIIAIWAGAAVAPVVLGVLVVAPMLYSALFARTSTIDKELVEVARLNGASRAKVFFYVTLPYAAPALPESLSTAFSFGVKVVVAAEILMQTANSLGMLMYLARTYLMTAMLIAFVVITVVISVTAEYLLRAILYVALAKYR